MPNSPYRRVKALVTFDPESMKLEEVVGSGYEISEGLVLSAAHVVEYILRRFDGLNYDQMGQMRLKTPAATRAFSEGTLQSRGRVLCVSWDEANSDLLFQSVIAAGVIERTELAILEVGPDISYKLQKALLDVAKTPIDIDFRPPSPGLEVWSMGYPGGDIKDGDDGKQHGILNPVQVSGPVTEVHGNIDQGGFGYPQFWVQMSTDGGMSGAPVFEKENGRLVGLVSKSFDTYDRTTVAMLWPLGTGDVVPGKTLADLVTEGRVRGVDHDQVTTNEDNVSTYLATARIGEGRCHSKTKANHRCSRRAKALTGRCWQHQRSNLD